MSGQEKRGLLTLLKRRKKTSPLVRRSQDATAAIGPYTQVPPIRHLRMHDEYIQPFKDSMIAFIGRHALTHESMDQRHFEAIVSIFYSDKTNGEKLVQITAKLQEADEYVYGPIKESLGFGRHRETTISYERLYQHLLSNFSPAILGETPLLARVKAFLARPTETPFRIEETLSIELLPAPPGGFNSAPPHEGFEDARPRDYRLAITTLYQLIAHHLFAQGGTLSTHTFSLIRSCVSEDILTTGSLSPRSILDIQVRLHSALNDEINPFRRESTKVFYESLEQELFKTGHAFREIAPVYEKYRAELQAEKQRMARVQAEALSMGHFA